MLPLNSQIDSQKIWSSLRQAPRWLWIAAILPRLFLLVSAWIEPSRCLRSDSMGYLTLAEHVLHLHFSDPLGTGSAPETFRTPGYPLFLAFFVELFRNPAFPVALVQCALGALSAALGWLWYQRLSGPRGALIGGLILALDPVMVLHTPMLMTEALFIFLLILACLELWRSIEEPQSIHQAALTGFLWSLTALVRPISFYLPPFLCWIWWKNKKSLSVFLVAAYLIPFAWTLRNWQATGYASFSSLGGHDLLRYPAAGVESLRTGRPWSELDVELRQQIDSRHPNGYVNEAEKSAEYGKAASTILKAHPVLLAEFAAWGSVKVLAGTGGELLLDWLGVAPSDPLAGDFRAKVTGHGTMALLKEHPLLIPYQLLYMTGLAALYISCLLGLAALWKAGRKQEVLLLTICLLYFLGLASTQGYYRFRIPLLPFLAAGTAAFFNKIEL